MGGWPGPGQGGQPAGRVVCFAVCETLSGCYDVTVGLCSGLGPCVASLVPAPAVNQNVPRHRQASPGQQHRPRREHGTSPMSLQQPLPGKWTQGWTGGHRPREVAGRACASLSPSPALDGWPGDNWASALVFPFLPPEDQLPPGFPNIDMGPQLKVVERTRTATMLCAASGNPDPEITWFKDFLPVDPSASNGRIKQLRSGEHRRPVGCGRHRGQPGEGGSSPAQGLGTDGQKGGDEGRRGGHGRWGGCLRG